MANPEHVKILIQGVEVWNNWRLENFDIHPDLSNIDLRGLMLDNVNFTWCDLRDSDLSNTNINKAHFNNSIMQNAKLHQSLMQSTSFGGANLTEVDMGKAVLDKADFRQATLYKANLVEACLNRTLALSANFSRANLTDADLAWANCSGADFSGAILKRANLKVTNMVSVNFKEAILSSASVYGMAVWDMVGEPADQSNLIISRQGQPEITVDSIDVAQFIHLLLYHDKIRDAVDTIGKKGVLILGRFSPERKAVLNAIREKLREFGFLPMMFDFDPLTRESTLKTLSTLAHLSRFVIADLTDAKSVLQELTTILKDLPTLPVKPIIHESDDLPPMGDSFLIMQSMLKPYVYSTQTKLLDDLKGEVIDPAEECIETFEAQLADIRRKWFPWQQK